MKTCSLKITLVFLLLFASFYQAKAQKKIWSIGPEIGVNFSKYGMDAPANQRNAGIIGGVFFTYSVINTFGITGKILYAEKGSIRDGREQTLQYIELPLTGRFFLNKEGKFRPNLFLGPSFAFLQGVTNKEGNADPVRLKEYESFYNTFDFGVTGGLGFNYQLIPATRLLIDARYTYGLNDISKADGHINNETISVTVGMSFGI